jgi:hypothetical protein
MVHTEGAEMLPLFYGGSAMILKRKEGISAVTLLALLAALTFISGYWYGTQKQPLVVVRPCELTKPEPFPMSLKAAWEQRGEPDQ